MKFIVIILIGVSLVHSATLVNNERNSRMLSSLNVYHRGQYAGQYPGQYNPYMQYNPGYNQQQQFNTYGYNNYDQYHPHRHYRHRNRLDNPYQYQFNQY
jgi:hypothetical protein